MLNTCVISISESYKKKATPRAEQTGSVGASGCGQCERVKATLVKYCILFPCTNIYICVVSLLFGKFI